MLAAVLNGDATALKAILQTPKRCLTTPNNESWTILHEAACLLWPCRMPEYSTSRYT